MKIDKLLKTKKELEDKFPSWEVTHTGGGIFLMRKDFKSKSGNNIMVSIGEENVIIVKHKDYKNCEPLCFASMEEYKKNESYYWENAYEHEIVLVDKAVKINEEAIKILTSKTLKKIVCNFVEFVNIIQANVFGKIEFNKKTAEEIRVFMSTLGWSSEDRLSDLGRDRGKFSYSIWFFRWDWHGVSLGNKVTIYSHTDNLKSINKIVARTAEKALQAWEQFPDKVPVQLANGKIVAEHELLQPEGFKADKTD